MAHKKVDIWQDDEHLILLRGWAIDGVKLVDIADRIGIHINTLYSWRTRHADTIGNALSEGKEVADYRVMIALYEAAIGGSITAMIFWLKARCGWRDDGGAEDGGQIVVTHSVPREGETGGGISEDNA